jgi:polar amino acid transport system permease protein
MVAWSARSVLIEATIVTIQIFAVSVVLALVLSLLLGVALASESVLVRWGARIWCELFRGVSLTVQLFWLYFVMPFFGVTLPAMGAAVAALALCFGAYGAETVRAALQAVSGGQREAAASLGFRPAQTFRLVVLPQAFRLMLPGLGNLAILVLKGTSVTALITIPELSFQAFAINNNFGSSLSVLVFVICAYYAMAKIAISATRYMERATALPGSQT